MSSEPQDMSPNLPMQSDRIYNITQLISPPPEEILRRNSRHSFLPEDTTSDHSKRKRRIRDRESLQPDQTPNPKPRKQAKPPSVDSESPTRLDLLQVSETLTTPRRSERLSATPIKPPKEEADPFLTTSATVRPTRTRRSVTPTVPYEPPSVVFTPPREIIATPMISKSSRRKAKSKPHPKLGAIKIIPVKKELPDIDLSVPMPPPSPTDDPILLSGPPSIFTSSPCRTRTSVAVASTQTDSSPSSNDNLDSEGGAYYDWREHTRPVTSDPADSTSLMDVHPSDADVMPVDLPAFSLNDLPPSSDAWSDSDEEAVDAMGAAQDAVEEGEGEYTGKWKTLLVRTKLDPPSSVTRARMEQWGRPISPFPEEAKSIRLFDDDHGDLNADEEADHQDVLEEEEVLRISLEPDEVHEAPQETHTPAEEMHIDRSFSDIPSNLHELDSPNATGIVPLEVAEPSNIVITQEGNVATVNGDAGSSDSEAEESLVKISSADPRAAARAAAILKQYDYDCFTEITKSKRRRPTLRRVSRRVTDIGEALARNVFEGRITKDKARRRSSIGTGVLGSQVFISGVPITTLGSLLKEAEAEVSFNSTPRLPIASLCKSTADHLFGRSLTDVFTNQGGEGHWTKDDWKLLDSCFTDERLALGQGDENDLANVDAIDLNRVVQRYLDLHGGEDVVKQLGPDWDRELIMQRTKALRRKQRSGNLAPPTTPLSSHSMSFGAPHNPYIDIPDFTPLRERLAFKRAIQPPQEDETTSLYTHLLKEATAVGNDPANLAPNTATCPSGEFHDSSVTLPTTPTTLGGRVKGFLYSYLPSLTKLASNSRRTGKHEPQKYGLPLPPPDLLDKRRGPIATPARPPLPKSKHPKDLVQLHPAPLPAQKVSRIPRLAEPRRLVKLNPIPPPEPRDSPPKFKPRRSSGSVKDLINSFEQWKRTNEEGTALQSKIPKPAWRP